MNTRVDNAARRPGPLFGSLFSGLFGRELQKIVERAGGALRVLGGAAS